jgi:general secretion pathway protein A
MYETFFGLREPAFALTPDPRFLWLSDTHEEGLAALCYGITRRKGFILLTGEVGAGKTTLLRAALDQIPAETEFALVMNTAGLRPLDLLKLIAVELRLEGALDSKVDYIIALNELLLRRLEAGLNTVLIIDEAQNLGSELLEEVRLLSNLETDTEKLLQIVLTGQPELRSDLASPELRQLRQRIAVEHHVEFLRPDEVASYLAYRIEVAGGSYEEIFAAGSEATFYAFSKGCPRLVSLLADRTLLSAYGKSLRPVPPGLVDSKAKEMDAARSQGPGDPGEAEGQRG